MKHPLRVEGLYKSYGALEAVKRVSFSMEPGEIFGLLGPNGAGKSTTINMIAGVSRFSEGKISIFGFDNQADFVTTRRLTGVMHQEIVVDTFFTIEEALKMHAGYYGVADDPAWRKKLIERLALGPHLKKPMNKLSGGMKRRFMVGKALIHKPKLLILDEPTAGVDVELRKTLWDFVREMNRQDGTAVMLTTHYLEEAEEMCARVAIMNQGNIVALDRTRDLRRKFDEKRLVVHLDKEITEIPANLTRLSCEIANGGSSVFFTISSENTASEVLAEISAARLSIREIETKLPSLEDVFIRLTGVANGK